MKFPKIAASALAVTFAITAVGCSSQGGGSAAADQSYNWDFTVTVSDTSSWYKAAEKFADELNKTSNGRIKVNVFANEQLSGGDPAAGVEQLMNGDKAFSYNSTIIYSGIDPKFGAINAPFLYKSYDEADKVTKGAGLEAYKKLAEQHGVKLLGFGESGFRQVTTTSKPITKPEDLAGLKMRVPGSSLFLDIYRDFKSDPITMNFSEVFTSLQNKTIDGQENPLDVIYSNGLAEVQNNLTMWNYIYDPLMLGMNQDTYDKLSDADKKLVEDAAKVANEAQIADNRKREETQLAELKKKMKVVELNDAQLSAFRDAVSPIYDKYKTVWTDEMTTAVAPK